MRTDCIRNWLVVIVVCTAVGLLIGIRLALPGDRDPGMYHDQNAELMSYSAGHGGINWWIAGGMAGGIGAISAWKLRPTYWRWA